MAVISRMDLDSSLCLACVRVCAKLASAMQSIKGFCAGGLWKIGCYTGAWGAIQIRSVRPVAGEKVPRRMTAQELSLKRNTAVIFSLYSLIHLHRFQAIVADCRRDADLWHGPCFTFTTRRPMRSGNGFKRDHHFREEGNHDHETAWEFGPLHHAYWIRRLGHRRRGVWPFSPYKK